LPNPVADLACSAIWKFRLHHAQVVAIQSVRARINVGVTLKHKRCAPYPVTTPPDDRSPIARAYAWATRIMVAALTMVLPGLAGHWLDERLGTVVLFLLAGLGLGCTAATFQLMQIIRSENQRKSNGK
jgi:hypothetical protein